MAHTHAVGVVSVDEVDDEDVPVFVDVDDDLVAVAMLQRGRLSGTRSWVELRCGLLYTVRDRRLHRAQVFPSLEDAVAAQRAKARA